MEYNGYIHKFCTYLLKEVFSYRKKVINENLNSTLLMAKPDKSQWLIGDYYKNLSAYILETIQLFSKDIQWFQNRIHYEGIEEMRECLTRSSVIVAGSHMGNWEWSAVLFPFFTQMPAFAVYKPLSNKKLDGPVKASRSRFGLGLLNMKEVVRFINKKHQPAVFFFIADQSPADINSGSWYSFLGKDTLFYNGPQLISEKFHLPVFMQTISRLDGNAYKVVFHRLAADHITSDFVKNLELDIYKHPEAWLWSHRRWKHKKMSLQK